jgi:hypothetical protein
MDKKRTSRAKPKPKPVSEPPQPVIPVEDEPKIIEETEQIEEAKEEKKVQRAIWMY